MSRLEAIDETYSRLTELLVDHGPDCAWRCLRDDCRGGHACEKCTELEEDAMND